VAQDVVATQPAARSFKLGALEIEVVPDSSIAVPNNGSVFGLNPTRQQWQTDFGRASAIHQDLMVQL
jgi:hypothetical protein